MKKSKLKEKNKALELRVEQLEGRIKMIGSLKDCPPKDLMQFLLNGTGSYMPEPIIKERKSVDKEPDNWHSEQLKKAENGFTDLTDKLLLKRRSGTTTRLIDQCIQHLFTYGEIEIPLNPDAGVNFVDYLAYHKDAQKDLIEKVEKRLQSEHPNMYERAGKNIFFTKTTIKNQRLHEPTEFKCWLAEKILSKSEDLANIPHSNREDLLKYWKVEVNKEPFPESEQDTREQVKVEKYADEVFFSKVPIGDFFTRSFKGKDILFVKLDDQRARDWDANQILYFSESTLVKRYSPSMNYKIACNAEAKNWGDKNIPYPEVEPSTRRDPYTDPTV